MTKPLIRLGFPLDHHGQAGNRLNDLTAPIHTCRTPHRLRGAGTTHTPFRLNGINPGSPSLRLTSPSLVHSAVDP